MGGSLHVGALCIRVPCYIGYLKRDLNLENHPYVMGTLWV